MSTPSAEHAVIIATRGSALALTQANLVLNQCRAAFPKLSFELNIIKTTGDKLQTAALAQPGLDGTKGLFTKELEVALLNREADLAVHSLKDLPTELPDGLELGAVSARADVRDVFICRSSSSSPSGPSPLASLRDGAVIATSSTRRQAQLLASRPGLKTVPIRGNVGTRLRKLAGQQDIDALVLAAAGLQRLGYEITPGGELRGKDVPPGLHAVYLTLEEMLPCVGQAALGIESRASDPRTDEICAALDDAPTHRCVEAERAFLRAMGGGCLSPVAAFAEIHEGKLHLRAASFRSSQPARAEIIGEPGEATALGGKLAGQLKD